jgi:hypothetical protein
MQESRNLERCAAARLHEWATVQDGFRRGGSPCGLPSRSSRAPMMDGIHKNGIILPINSEMITNRNKSSVIDIFCVWIIFLMAAELLG